MKQKSMKIKQKTHICQLAKAFWPIFSIFPWIIWIWFNYCSITVTKNLEFEPKTDVIYRLNCYHNQPWMKLKTINVLTICVNINWPSSAIFSLELNAAIELCSHKTIRITGKMKVIANMLITAIFNSNSPCQQENIETLITNDQKLIKQFKRKSQKTYHFVLYFLAEIQFVLIAIRIISNLRGKWTWYH